MASGFLGRYHHQIIVCIYFNGQFLNRRKVANHDENPEKNAHPKMGKLEARNALRCCHLGVWSTLATRRHEGGRSHYPAILAAAPVAANS
ncbi:hypothetical protein KZ773_27590 [Escherichia coli]|nr:hypothetical protein [Escherichia coli]